MSTDGLVGAKSFIANTPQIETGTLLTESLQVTASGLERVCKGRARGVRSGKGVGSSVEGLCSVWSLRSFGLYEFRKPYILNPKPKNQSPNLFTLNPTPPTLKPQNLNPKQSSAPSDASTAARAAGNRGQRRPELVLGLKIHGAIGYSIA